MTSHEYYPSSSLPHYGFHLDQRRHLVLDQTNALRINGQSCRDLLRNLRFFFVATWLDWLTLASIGAVAAAVWISPHSFTRLFPMTDASGRIYWPDIAYPYTTPVFSPALAGALSAVIPLCVFAIAQFWQQSFADFASAVLGLAYSMVTGTCMQVILKKTIGGLRPHFLAVCRPVLTPSHGGVGFERIMYTAAQVCTGDPRMIRNGLESFPSGHAEVAFAGLGYLAIYLFAHLRVGDLERRGGYWKMLAVVAPLLIATYESSTLVLGYHHHGYDVIAGAVIGCLVAVFGYRMAFKGIVDQRWNAVPYLVLRKAESVSVDGIDVVSTDRERGQSGDGHRGVG